MVQKEDRHLRGSETVGGWERGHAVMDPIEQYLKEIAPRLPRHKRLNVLAELRRNIDDRIGQLESEGYESTAATVKVVAELGDPNELAAEYGGGRVIIPATRYHIFKASASVLVGLHLLATCVTTLMDVDVLLLFVRLPNLRGWSAHEVLWVLTIQVLADIGIVTLFFWSADLTLPRKLAGMAVRARTAEAKPHWSGLILPLILLGVFNIWRNELFVLQTANAETWYELPILSPAFIQTYLWPVNLVLLLALGIHTYKIISGPTLAAACAELIYRLSAFALTGALLGVEEPFELNVGQLQSLEPVLVGVFRLVLLAAMFSNAFATYRAGARVLDRVK